MSPLPNKSLTALAMCILCASPLAHGLEYTGSDGNIKLTFGGRIQADSAFFDSDLTEFSDASEFRRARVLFGASLFRDWTLRYDYDFASTSSPIKNAFIRYEGLENTRLTLGHFQEPFSMEELTSSGATTFMERALPNTFAPGYHLGAAINTHSNDWTFAAGIFDRALNSNKDSGHGYSVRLTYAPVRDENRTLHVGFASAYRNPESDTVRYSASPESNIANHDLVRTGTISNVDHTTGYGFEAAAQFGSYSLQGEYIITDVNRSRDDVSFSGAYLYASWFITGETRNYNSRTGVLGGIKPLRKFDLTRKGYGAWELAARYSTIDLNDGPIHGGREGNITLGLNWYLNSTMRFTANYISVYSKRRDTRDDPAIFQLRAQVNF